MLALPARAACVLPYTLLNGTLADAGQVMANFNTLVNCLGTNFGTPSANTFYAGPTSGAPGNATFRPLLGADLPVPSATSLGGVESIAAVSGKFVTSISTLGVPVLGTVSTAMLTDIGTFSLSTSGPATLTGGLTVSGGLTVNAGLGLPVVLKSLPAGSASYMLCYTPLTGVVSYATAAGGCALGAAN